MNVSSETLLYLIPAVTSALLALYAWRRREYPEAVPFALLMLALVVWSVCQALSVGSATFAGARFWGRLEFAGIVFVGPLWLLLALTYAGRGQWITRRLYALLFVPALLAFATELTNDWHQLWWSSVRPDTSNGYFSIVVTHGPLFWLHLVFSYSCIAAGMWLLLRATLETPPLYQRQAWLMFIGGLVPAVGNLAYVFGAPVQIIDDPTTFLFAISGLFFGYATFRYRLLDLAPIAHREIFESMPDGVVVLDRRGVVVSCNGAASRLFAVAPAEWVGQPLLTAIAASPLAEPVGALLASASTAATRSSSYSSVAGLMGVEIRLQPLPVGRGVRSGALLVLRDVTERTRAEQAEREAIQMKETFFAIMTHELRSPMTSVIGFVDMLNGGFFGPLPEATNEPLGHIRHNSRRLLTLINDILDYSKIEAGYLNIDQTPIVIDGIVEAVIGAMQPQLYERGLELVVAVQPDLPLVSANSVRLEQVLVNLFANAVKFTTQGGITVRAEQHGDTVQISVQDTGIGIEPSQQQAVFAPFRQVDHHHRHYGGTGLGLAISKRLMEMMGGTLTLESTPGVGSTFTCTLHVTKLRTNGSTSAFAHAPEQVL